MSKQSQDAVELSRLFMAEPDSSAQMVIKAVGQDKRMVRTLPAGRGIAPQGSQPWVRARTGEKKSLFMHLIRFKFNVIRFQDLMQ